LDAKIASTITIVLKKNHHPYHFQSHTYGTVGSQSNNASIITAFKAT
jgi:hypothetical protein